jgi:putative DNA primase/helicase
MADNLTPLERVLERVKNVARYDGYFMASCPAHPDEDPSLSITVGDDRRALVNCFAGCSAESIVEALDLTMSDLFPESSKGRGGQGVSLPQKQYIRAYG